MTIQPVVYVACIQWYTLAVGALDTNRTYHFVQYSEVSLSQGLLMYKNLFLTRLW